MDDLTFKALLEKFFWDSGKNPSEVPAKFAYYKAWLEDNITSDPAVKMILDAQEYPNYPHLPPLKALVTRSKKVFADLADEKRSREYLTGDYYEECFYCGHGLVENVYKDEAGWFDASITGRCTKCRRGRRYPGFPDAEPMPWLIEFARKRDVDCPEAAKIFAREKNMEHTGFEPQVKQSDRQAMAVSIDPILQGEKPYAHLGPPPYPIEDADVPF